MSIGDHHQWFDVTAEAAILAVEAAILDIEEKKRALERPITPEPFDERTARSSFHLWRRRQGLSQNKAAQALEVTSRTVQYWDKGLGPRQERMVPPRGIRVLMTAMARKIELEPWPE